MEADVYDPRTELAAALARAIELPRQRAFDRNGYKPASESPLEQLTYFLQAVRSGAIPTPDSLLFFADAISRYIESKGRLSLDEAFRLKSIPSVGNPAGQSAKRNRTNILLFEMAILRVKDDGLSLPDAAAQLSKDDSKGTEATRLVSAYRRKKAGRRSIGETYENAIRDAVGNGTMTL